MPLIPWRPFWDLWPEEDWPDWERPRWGRMLPAIRSPRMDVYEDNGNIVAEAELPGIDPKNIEVEVKDNVLRVEAKTEEKKEEKKKDYYRQEMSRGLFKRVTSLPAEVIAEKAKAEFKEGVLKVVIPKAKARKEKKKGVRIKVKGTETA